MDVYPTVMFDPGIGKIYFSTKTGLSSRELVNIGLELDVYICHRSYGVMASASQSALPVRLVAVGIILFCVLYRYSSVVFLRPAGLVQDDVGEIEYPIPIDHVSNRLPHQGQ